MWVSESVWECEWVSESKCEWEGEWECEWVRMWVSESVSEWECAWVRVWVNEWRLSHCLKSTIKKLYLIYIVLSIDLTYIKSVIN